MRAFAVQAEIPVEQQRAKGCIGGNDRLTVLVRERPHNIDVARLERRREIFRGSAKSGVEPCQLVVDNKDTRPQGNCSGIQHGVTPIALLIKRSRRIQWPPPPSVPPTTVAFEEDKIFPASR